jgi:probable HAF family extracellular repeat protein
MGIKSAVPRAAEKSKEDCMPFRLSRPCWKMLLSPVILSVVSVCQTPTQASCTYTFFPTVFFTPPLSRYSVFSPFGINDSRTVVGGAFQTGFVRWGNGGFTFPKGTSSLSDRNDKGISIGYDGNNSPIILSGTSVTSAAVAIGAKIFTGPGVVVSRINDFGSIVGWYGDNSGVAHGYKRWTNGHGFKLDFPAHFQGINSGTFATGINDLGMVVGFTQIPYHAFVYYNGVWTTLQYPKAIATMLWGVSNAGIMIGSAELADGSSIGFLYKNGKFEKVVPPGTLGPGVGSNVTAISLRKGLILGFADLRNSPRQGYIATCK